MRAGSYSIQKRFRFSESLNFRTGAVRVLGRDTAHLSRQRLNEEKTAGRNLL
jgi:hypothetical protein